MEEEENHSLQTEPTWEHTTLSGTDSILCARYKSILWEAPRGETRAQEWNLERSDLGFDHQPGAFRSGRAHQWLSVDLTGENFSAHNH